MTYIVTDLAIPDQTGAVAAAGNWQLAYKGILGKGCSGVKFAWQIPFTVSMNNSENGRSL
jgi:hypothetical protein